MANQTTFSHDTVLTPMDVKRLLRDSSADSRASVLEKISNAYNSDSLKDRECTIAEQIFRLLMKDVALRVREALAERLKDNDAVPRDIILHMANDVDSVAVPVLSSSMILSDADLVSVVEQSPNMDKLIAISTRPVVSTRVSSALVETNYAQVMISLLANEGASIGDRSLERISDDFYGNVSVITALAGHHKLPITVVERIVSQVSDDVATQLRARYQLVDEDIRKNSGAVREDFVLRLLEQDMTQDEIEALVHQMAQENRLTPSMVMTSLCRGQLRFFTAAIAQFSSIPTANAARLIADRGDNGFVGLYQKSGLPESMRDAVHLLLRAVQEMRGDKAVAGSMLYANRLVQRVIEAADDRQIDYLPYFLALIRQKTP